MRDSILCFAGLLQIKALGDERDEFVDAMAMGGADFKGVREAEFGEFAGVQLALRGIGFVADENDRLVRAAQFAGERFVWSGALDGADVAGGQKSIGGVGRIGADVAQDGGHQKLRDEQGDIALAALARQISEHGVGGRGGFKTNGEMHHLFFRLLAGEVQGLQRGGDHADIRAAGLGGEEVAVGGRRYAEQIAEGGDDGSRLARDGDGVVEVITGGDAHRAAGAVEQMDVRRQQRVQRVAQNGVGLATADFHDARGPPGDARDLRGKAADGGGVGVFGEVEH